MNLFTLKETAYQAAMSLITYAHLEEHSLFVVGCSSSEIQGEKIGTDSNPDVAKDVFEGIYEATQQAKIYLAAQCCEHLNRALILESEAAIFYDLDLVNVVPMPKAGGSFATAAYRTFTHPVAVEHIQAHAGMDIGNTFIGMHLKDVVVPCRFEITKIGAASISYARTRPKFIGGSRAAYDDSLIN